MIIFFSLITGVKLRIGRFHVLSVSPPMGVSGSASAQMVSLRRNDTGERLPRSTFEESHSLLLELIIQQWWSLNWFSVNTVPRAGLGLSRPPRGPEVGGLWIDDVVVRFLKHMSDSLVSVAFRPWNSFSVVWWSHGMGIDFQGSELDSHWERPCWKWMHSWYRLTQTSTRKQAGGTSNALIQHAVSR